MVTRNVNLDIMKIDKEEILKIYKEAKKALKLFYKKYASLETESKVKDALKDSEEILEYLGLVYQYTRTFKYYTGKDISTKYFIAKCNAANNIDLLKIFLKENFQNEKYEISSLIDKFPEYRQTIININSSTIEDLEQEYITDEIYYTRDINLTKKALEMYRETEKRNANMLGFKDVSEYLLYVQGIDKKVLDNCISLKEIKNMVDKMSEYFTAYFNKDFEKKLGSLEQHILAMSSYIFSENKMNLKMSIQIISKIVEQTFKGKHADYVTKHSTDIYESENAAVQSICAISYAYKPSIITDKVKNINDLFILAHELGHAAETSYNTSKLIYTNGYEEIPSLMYENAVYSKLINCNKDGAFIYLSSLKLYLIDYPIYIYLQKELLSGKDIIESFSYVSKYVYGNTFNLNEIDKFAYLQETFMTDKMELLKYYLGNLVSLNVLDKIDNKDKDICANYERYLEFTDSMDMTKRIDKYLGIDMLDKAYVESAYARVTNIIDKELSKLK
ncbi:MAG: hypothetical protein RR922_06230 [Clostridia bacterium]